MGILNIVADGYHLIKDLINKEGEDELNRKFEGVYKIKYSDHHFQLVKISLLSKRQRLFEVFELTSEPKSRDGVQSVVKQPHEWYGLFFRYQLSLQGISEDRKILFLPESEQILYNNELYQKQDFLK